MHRQATRDLERAWRGPRWWQKFHGMDPQNYRKWRRRQGGLAAGIALAFGIALLATDKTRTGGVVLVALGLAEGAVVVWARR